MRAPPAFKGRDLARQMLVFEQNQTDFRMLHFANWKARYFLTPGAIWQSGGSPVLKRRVIAGEGRIDTVRWTNL